MRQLGLDHPGVEAGQLLDDEGPGHRAEAVGGHVVVGVAQLRLFGRLERVGQAVGHVVVLGRGLQLEAVRLGLGLLGLGRLRGLLVLALHLGKRFRQRDFAMRDLLGKFGVGLGDGVGHLLRAHAGA